MRYEAYPVPETFELAAEFYYLNTMPYLIAASLLFVLGGVSMVKSAGFTEIWPSLLVFVFFGIAATLQTLGMKAQEVGVAYVLVLGLEAVFACIVGIVWLREPFSWPKALGTLLVVAGIILLKYKSA